MYPICAICFSGLLSGIVGSLIETIILLYLNHVSFTTSIDTTLYVHASAFLILVPIPCNLIIAKLTCYHSPVSILSHAYLAVSVALIAIAFNRSRTVFYPTFIVYASLYSFRIVRLSVLSQLAPPSIRTSILTTHQLMSPVGVMLGPLLWLILQRWRSSFYLFPKTSTCTIDRFTVVFLTCAILCSLMSVMYRELAHRSIRAIDFLSESSRLQQPLATNTAPIDSNQDKFKSVGIDNSISRKSELRVTKHIIVLAVVLACVRASFAFYSIILQPVMVYDLHASDELVGKVQATIGFLAIFPPLLAAVAARYVPDYPMLVLGLGVKLIGMALQLPLYTAKGIPSLPRLVAGYVFVVEGSHFFSTTVMSAITKIVAPEQVSTVTGVIWAGVNIFPAIVQLLLGSHIVSGFGSWYFALFALPTIIGVSLLIWYSDMNINGDMQL